MGAVAGPWPPWAEEDTREPIYPEVSTTVEELAGRIGERGLVVVDARPRGAYLSGHVPGALSIPAFGLPDPPESAGALAEHGLTGRERIVCYGETSYSADAARLFWLLEAEGAERASILMGGASAWSGAGNELDQEERTLPAATWAVEPRSDRVATTAYVALKFGEEGFEIIDARGWDAWEGEAETADPGDPALRTGHIPHALPFDFREIALPDGRLAPAEDARRILAAFGPRPSTPVDLWDEFIVHDDGLSGEGAVGYFLLRRSGVEAVRYYPGGWRDWASDPNLPIVRIVHAEELETRLARARRWFRPNAPPSTFAVFDVRHSIDFGREHIPGAVNLNSRVFADSLDAYIEQRWPDLDRSDAPVVTYCYGSNCIRSRDCATVAARRGFLNVLRFYGGIVEWKAEGGRVITGR
jgi:thiosulfate/3-mercaptopyruvate sulfurtransferase